MCDYRCIQCRGIFSVDDAPSVSNSHGLCPKCLRLALLETGRRQQRKQKLHDCAGMAKELCSQGNCTYWPICFKEVPSRADFEEVWRRLEQRTVALHGEQRIHHHAELMAIASAR